MSRREDGILTHSDIRNELGMKEGRGRAPHWDEAVTLSLDRGARVLGRRKSQYPSCLAQDGFFTSRQAERHLIGIEALSRLDSARKFSRT